MDSPHDKFFKETMTRKENAVSFFREYLPEEIVSNADWRTLSISKDSFVDEELKERFSDIVYTIRIKGKQMFICILLEHQSYVDPWMAFRVLRYMIKIWELYIKQNHDSKKLPGILPVVFYHGKDKWKINKHFKNLIQNQDLMECYIPDFEYILKDFSRYTDEEIKGTVMLRLFLTVMKNADLPGFENEFRKLVPLFVELSKKNTGMEYIEAILRYIFNVSEVLKPKDVEDVLINALEENKRGVIMTIADQLRNEGRIEGEIKGKIKTYQELLTTGLLPRELAEKKIAELIEELKKLNVQFQTD